MNLALDIFFCIVAAATVGALGLEYRRCLTMLQQNSYVNSRYRTWLSQSSDTTSMARLLAIAVLLVGMATTLLDTSWTMLLIAILDYAIIASILRVKMKKKLVMTKRAWRIYSVMWTLSVGFIIGSWLLFHGDEGVRRGMFVVTMTCVGLYCLSHVVTLLANWLLQPVERGINGRYRRDAERILASMPDLKIVGVTGSYGKTSTKHFLHRILSEKYDTMMTPGNFNTTLGVIRTIRENLKPYNEVFIVEMGAKNLGDIADICRLVHPTIGIVTAVGPQHLETFKSIENVQKTKFELVDALPADGLAVINNDFEKIAEREVNNVEAVRYGVGNSDADVTVEDIVYGTDNGTQFTVVDRRNGSREVYTTRLLGEANISDMAAAIVAARALGVEEDKIRYAIGRIEPVEHRLSVKQTPGGITILDDAYNSNPVGSAMALDVLRMMPCSGKRIIVTPGMVELGEEQYRLNREFGKKIPAAAHIAIIVNRANADAIADGMEEGGMAPTSIRKAASFAEAQAILATLMNPGDIVLYENDLPDTFK